MGAIFEFLNDPEGAVTLAFVIAIGFLVWKGSGIAVKALDDRAATIKAMLDDAAQQRQVADALLAEYQAKQRAALDEAAAMMAHATEEAERLSAEALADFEAAVTRREAAALDRIRLAEMNAVSDVRHAAIEAAIAATRAALVDSLDEAGSAALIDQAIADLPSRLRAA